MKPKIAITLISAFVVAIGASSFHFHTLYAQGQGAKPAQATANPAKPSAQGTGSSPTHGGLKAKASSEAGNCRSTARTNGETASSSSSGTTGGIGNAETETNPPAAQPGKKKGKSRTSPTSSRGRAVGKYDKNGAESESMDSGKGMSHNSDLGIFVYTSAHLGESIRSKLTVNPGTGRVDFLGTVGSASVGGGTYFGIEIEQSGNPPACNIFKIYVKTASNTVVSVAVHANGTESGARIIWRLLRAALPPGSTVRLTGNIIDVGSSISPIDIVITGTNSGTANGSGITDMDVR